MNQLSLHPNLHALFDLWSPPPFSARAMHAPVSGAFLDQVFIAEATQGAPPVRIMKAGQSLRTVYQDKLDGMDLFSLFGQQDRILVWTLMRTITLKSSPGLLRLNAIRSGRTTEIDLALAPLGGAGTSRYLGFFQPCEALAGIDAPLEVSSVHPPKGAQTLQ